MRIPTYNQYQHDSARISNEYDKMSRLLEQSSSGKKIQSSSEDPALGFQIKSHEDYLNILNSYADNGTLAQSRAALFNSSLQNMTKVGSDVQTLLKKAQSGVVTPSERAALGQQLSGNIQNFLQFANTQDATGNYIYSGTNATSATYQFTNGGYQYQGSAEPLTVNIAPNTNVVYGDTGNAIFDRFYGGNGTYAITADAANTGSASIAPGSVNPATYVADNYTVSIVTNADGKLAVSISGANSGQVIPAPPATSPDQAPAYTPGSTLSFNGISIAFEGQAASGDQFQIQPSQPKNMFDLLQGIADVLNNPNLSDGQYRQLITQADAAFSQVNDRLANYQSQAGTRSSQIDQQLDLNKTVIQNQTVSLNELANADMPQVYSALAQQSLILQATTDSYMKMQEMLEKLFQMQR